MNASNKHYGKCPYCGYGYVEGATRCFHCGKLKPQAEDKADAKPRPAPDAAKAVSSQSTRHIAKSALPKQPKRTQPKKRAQSASNTESSIPKATKSKSPNTEAGKPTLCCPRCRQLNQFSAESCLNCGEPLRSSNRRNATSSVTRKSADSQSPAKTAIPIAIADSKQLDLSLVQGNDHQIVPQNNTSPSTSRCPFCEQPITHHQVTLQDNDQFIYRNDCPCLESAEGILFIEGGNWPRHFKLRIHAIDFDIGDACWTHLNFQNQVAPVDFKDWIYQNAANSDVANFVVEKVDEATTIVRLSHIYCKICKKYAAVKNASCVDCDQCLCENGAATKEIESLVFKPRNPRVAESQSWEVTESQSKGGTLAIIGAVFEIFSGLLSALFTLTLLMIPILGLIFWVYNSSANQARKEVASTYAPTAPPQAIRPPAPYINQAPQTPTVSTSDKLDRLALAAAMVRVEREFPNPRFPPVQELINGVNPTGTNKWSIGFQAVVTNQYGQQEEMTFSYFVYYFPDGREWRVLTVDEQIRAQ